MSKCRQKDPGVDVVDGVRGLHWAKGVLHSMPGGQGSGPRAAKLFGQKHCKDSGSDRYAKVYLARR